MKKEQLYEVLGEINETYVSNANKASKKIVVSRSTKSMWLKWGSVAACFCLMVLVAVFVLNNNIVWGPAYDDEADYGNTISYVGWTEDETLYKGALNYELLQNDSSNHLPFFKIDTLEELEQFKAFYGNIVSFDQGYDSVLSFDAAMSKAQWDRDIFYQKHSLLIIYIPANSGSLRFGVKEVETTDTSICISVEQKNNPEVFTEDMAGWFLLMEVKDEEICKYTSFDAVLTSK